MPATEGHARALAPADLADRAAACHRELVRPAPEAAKNEPLRGKLEADNRPLRSSAAKLTGMILLTALFDQPAQMERLAAEVVPHLS